MTTLSIQTAERPAERETSSDRAKEKPRPESAERFRAALNPNKQAQAAAAKQPRFVTTRQGENPAVTRAFPHANPQLSATLKQTQNTSAQAKLQSNPQTAMPLAGQAAGAQTLAELKQLAAQQQTQNAEASATSADGGTAQTSGQPTEALLPTQAPQSQALATPAGLSPSQPGPQAPLANPALMQQVVEFAAVSRNADGQSEFRLGFQQNTLDGARLKLTRLGRGRVSLQLTGTGIQEADVQDLIASLKKRRVEVAEVEYV